jgi:hypothetical protein
MQDGAKTMRKTAFTAALTIWMVSPVHADTLAPVNVSIRAESGKIIHVDSYFSINSNCVVVAIPTVAVVHQPEHGDIGTDTRSRRTSFSADSGYGKCSSRLIPSADVVYRSHPRYIGNDGFTYRVGYANGDTQDTTVEVTVQRPTKPAKSIKPAKPKKNKGE